MACWTGTKQLGFRWKLLKIINSFCITRPKNSLLYNISTKELRQNGISFSLTFVTRKEKSDDLVCWEILASAQPSTCCTNSLVACCQLHFWCHINSFKHAILYIQTVPTQWVTHALIWGQISSRRLKSGLRICIVGRRTQYNGQRLCHFNGQHSQTWEHLKLYFYLWKLDPPLLNSILFWMTVDLNWCQFNRLKHCKCPQVSVSEFMCDICGIL